MSCPTCVCCCCLPLCVDFMNVQCACSRIYCVTGRRGGGRGRGLCTLISCKFRVMFWIWGCVCHYMCRSYEDYPCWFYKCDTFPVYLNVFPSCCYNFHSIAIVPYVCPVFRCFQYPELLLLLLMSWMWPLYLILNILSYFSAAPSLTRRRVCLLYMLLVLASVVFLTPESLRSHDLNLLSQIWDFVFCRLLRLPRSRWRYSNPPPHR
jgi:hypothetical protein